MGRVAARPRAAGGGGPQRGRWLHRRAPLRCRRARQVDRETGCDRRRPPGRTGGRHSMSPGIPVLLAMTAMLGACAHAPSKYIADDQRSETQTSELTSQMRISYAVFGLKKK